MNKVAEALELMPSISRMLFTYGFKYPLIFMRLSTSFRSFIHSFTHKTTTTAINLAMARPTVKVRPSNGRNIFGCDGIKIL